MAVWTIPSDQVIDYSANGDDVDSFSQKVKFCIENIFACLQILKSNGAQAGLDGEAQPYEIRINTVDNCIYIRNGDNTDWILLGEVAEHFGLTAEDISAVTNGGGMGRLIMGNEKEMPTEGNSTFDLFFAQDTSRVFIWTGSAWKKFLSLNFGDMLDYEKYCVSKDEVTTIGGAAGAGKILRLDLVTGKGNIDITGSPERLLGYFIDVQNLKDGHVLVFNAEKEKFVNLPNYEITKADTTYQGGVDNAGKLIKVAPDGKIHADITGTTDQTSICTIPVDITKIEDGQILRYHVSTNTFRNEAPTPVGEGKSLILSDGENVLGDYNGSTTVTVNLQDVLNQCSLAKEVAHLMRLTENLYLALDEAELNPGGYDGLNGETFYGDMNDIDKTTINVLSVIQGDDSIDVETLDGLVEGSHYYLRKGSQILPVQIKRIVIENGINRVIFYNEIPTAYTSGSIKLSRTNGTVGETSMTGDGVSFVTNLIPFINEATGESIDMRRAHLVVKHDNVADAEITAEIAVRDGVKFVRGEVIGIGDGSTQTVFLAHIDNVSTYRFALYFDGVEQTEGFNFSPWTGEVTFTAASNVIVSADYFYDWATEDFVEMTKTGTYPDRLDQTRATTQFVCGGLKGSVATIRLTLKRGSGHATNEIVSTGTGKPRGFRLAHKPTSSSAITVSPTPTSKSFNASQNTVIVTSPVGKAIKISYNWKGDAFSVYQFACTFNE